MHRPSCIVLFFFIAFLSVDAAIVVRQADVVINASASPIPSQSAQPTQAVPPRPQVSPQQTSPQPSAIAPASLQPPVPVPPGVTPSVSPNVSAAGTPLSPTPVPGPPTTQNRGLSTGAIVGIVIGTIILALLVAVLLFLVLRGRNNDDNNAQASTSASGPGAGGAAGGYATPEAGATRSLPATAAVGGAGGAGLAASEGTIQEAELAEAEASMPGNDAGYVVSDSARHHGGVAAAPVIATAAGAGAAGLVAAAPPPNPDDRAPSPPPHDYVVGVGPIAAKSDFEDIKTRFARDEIVDKSAVLGATSPPAIEGNTTEDKNTSALEAPLETVEDVSSAAAVTTTPELAGKHDLLENVTNEERSGDVSVAVGGLGATDIIAEESAATPTLEKDAMPKHGRD